MSGAELPRAIRRALADCAEGRAPPSVAAMRILAEAPDPLAVGAAIQAITALIGRSAGDEAATRRLAELRDLLQDSPESRQIVQAVLAAVANDPENAALDAPAAVARWVERFDRAAAISPEASVALYSLGDPDRLAAATQEVVAAMDGWRLLGTDRTLLDIGCGIGRIEAALAGRVRLVVGIDVSAAMLAEARRRCAGLPDIAFVRGTGLDLAAFADARFDAVIAVDAFPYLVDVGLGLAETHLREAARVLRPRGRQLILNFSYRGDPAMDEADLRRLARAAGLSPVVLGLRPFAHWDGAAYLFEKGHS
jgi:ubiquinone/menaquinone biosynthesis C-methylase UbiE